MLRRLRDRIYDRVFPIIGTCYNCGEPVRKHLGYDDNTVPGVGPYLWHDDLCMTHGRMVL